LLLLCKSPTNLKVSTRDQHHHECNNGPSEVRPNTHVCEHCYTVFDVLPGEAGYIEAILA